MQSDVLRNEVPQIATIGPEDLLRKSTPSDFGLEVKLQVKLGDCVVPHANSPNHVTVAS